jgi:hypothetical protein
VEQRDPVSRRGPSLALVLLLVGSALPVSGGGDRVVLIVNAAGPAAALDAIDIKRLFLGIPVERGEITLHALRNDSDERLKQVFLQYVVSMSETAYQRRLLMLALEQGRSMPPAYTDGARLLAVVAADSGAVSYAWESVALRNPRVRILRELWHE